jgi:hypothetical protein
MVRNDRALRLKNRLCSSRTLEKTGFVSLMRTLIVEKTGFVCLMRTLTVEKTGFVCLMRIPTVFLD